MAGRLRVVILLGSVRERRICDRVTKFIRKYLEDAKFDVDVFDPQDMPFNVLKQPLHYYPDRSQAPDWLIDANEVLEKADGFVVVSAEYNSSIPPALSNMMDHFPPKTFSFRPTGILTYSMGNMGGCRAAVALRPFICELSSPTVPFSMSIPAAHNSLTEEGVPTDERLKQNAQKLVSHLEWYAQAMKAQTAKKGLPV